MDPCIHGEDPLEQKNADGRTAFQLYIVDLYKRFAGQKLSLSDTLRIFVTRSAKTGHTRTFCILEITLNALSFSCGIIQSHQIYCIISEVI